MTLETTEEPHTEPDQEHPDSDASSDPTPPPGAEAEAHREEPASVGDVSTRQSRRDERWRDRARSAEARADRLATREVLRLLGQRVADAEVALAMSGEEVRDLLMDDGDVDAQAVADLAARVLETHPALTPKNHHMDLGPKRSLPRGNSVSWDRLVRGK